MTCDKCGRGYPEVAVEVYYPSGHARMRSSHVRRLCGDCLLGRKPQKRQAS